MTAPLTTNHEAERLEQAIAALEAQRSALGDAVVEAGLAPMRERLEALRRKSPTSQQRKQITVLFADISGFTSLSEASDAEDVTETINTLWGLLDNVILEHGGVIDKHMGDAVMALWGAQTAREDDAERAVRAALEMQHVIQGAGLQINNSPIQMRIGVHTGPVFLSAVGLTGEYTAMGDTVNTSSRLQHLAPLGQVVISHDTYPHVRGIFDVSPLPVVHVEGKAEPLQAYRVEGAKQRAFRMGTRGLEGVLTRMVGRDEDLQALQEAVRGLLQDGKRRLVTIVGEAGIGKSRLLYEFENWLELQPERFRFFKGRASPEMQSQPYALIRDLLAYRFGIQENDPLGAVRRKMEQGLAETGALYLRGLQIAAPASSLVPSAQAPVQAQSIQSAIEMRAYFIGQLLGYNFGSTVSGPASPGGDARQLRDRALLYLSEFFQANAQARPTLVFLEDIHWADSQSLSVAETLAKDTGGADLPGVANAACPLLIVCLTRPSLFERHSEWDLEGSPGRLQAGFARQLTLTPLSKDASRQLVTEILQKATQVPEALRELIVSGAEGNPYYVEELIKMLIDDGVIVREAEFWRVEPDRL
jgi:class 3 adenylate cyclase